MSQTNLTSQQVSRSATLFVVCAAHFIMPFIMSAVGVALPAIGRVLGGRCLLTC